MYRILTLVMAVLVLTSCYSNREEADSAYNKYVKDQLSPKYPKDYNMAGSKKYQDHDKENLKNKFNFPKR